MTEYVVLCYWDAYETGVSHHASYEDAEKHVETMKKNSLSPLVYEIAKIVDGGEQG